MAARLPSLGAVAAEDVVSACHEALASHVQATALALEALGVPLEGVVRQKFCSRSDGLPAVGALLGVLLLEAGLAVEQLSTRAHVQPGQWRVAADAHEAVAVVGVLLVDHSLLRHRLVAGEATRGGLLLVAGHAVDLVAVRHKALGADGFHAACARKATLVPRAAFVSHLGDTFADTALAAHARVPHASCRRCRATLADDLLALEEVLGGGSDERRALTALEAAFVPVEVVEAQLLHITAPAVDPSHGRSSVVSWGPQETRRARWFFFMQRWSKAIQDDSHPSAM